MASITALDVASTSTLPTEASSLDPDTPALVTASYSFSAVAIETEAEIDTILETIALNGIFREIDPSQSDGPDPGDAHLWALLETQPGAVLVTGDHGLLDAPPEGASVVSPRAYAESLPGVGGRSGGVAEAPE